VHYECSDSPNKSNAPPGGRPLDAQFASLAARRHGVVTVAQLMQAGLTRAAIAHRMNVGRLHRVHRGVSAVGHRRLSREGRWMAAVLAAGEGAALAGLSAAELWRITRHRTDLSVVITPGQHRPQAGVRFRSCRRLDRRDVTVRDGIRVTTVARTQVDLTDVLTAHQLAYVIHEAGYRNRFNPRATRAAMERANGRRRLAVLDAALVLNALGSAGTRSDDEDRSSRSSRPPGSRSRWSTSSSASTRSTSAGGACAWRSTATATSESEPAARTANATPTSTPPATPPCAAPQTTSYTTPRPCSPA
jgi:hypothetical protein